MILLRPMALAGNGETTTGKPIVAIGGQPADVSFGGLATGFVGLYQVNAQISRHGLRARAHPEVTGVSQEQPLAVSGRTVATNLELAQSSAFSGQSVT